jgi:hypothetical protein
MNRLESFGTIESGVLKIIHASRFKESIKTLPNGRYKLTLEKSYRKRSNPQNAFYFGVVVQLVLEGLKDAGFTDMDAEKVHELLKFKFLKTDIISENGEVIETIGSTAKLTTTQFMEFLLNITHWAREYLNIEIPEPNQQMEMKL